MAPQTAYSSKNLFLAAIVALSVYVPFETVAKVSLVAGAFLFVVDPLPPYSRLIAVASCFTVLKLNQYHRDFVLEQQYEEEQASMNIVVSGDDNSANDDEGKGKSEGEGKKRAVGFGHDKYDDRTANHHHHGTPNPNETAQGSAQMDAGPITANNSNSNNTEKQARLAPPPRPPSSL